MNERLQDLSAAGVSVWLDDLSRERLETGNLADLVQNSSVVGVTTNPSIFAGALAQGSRYDAQVKELVGQDVEAAVFTLTSRDVALACDVLRPVHDATGGVDGKVSIEVSPLLADDEEATVAQAVELWTSIAKPNLMVKIPATDAGIRAISRVLGEGISVNVTLIFGLERYLQVMDAYLTGLERAQANGHDLSTIHSVASFFVSRVDTEVDARLRALEAPGGLLGKAALANARVAHRAYSEVFSSERWSVLAAAGARIQRPLWASTGVKDPAYPDTLYVTELAVPGSVNTMPEKTMQAFADHGETLGDRVSTRYAEADSDLAALAEAGIDLDDVIAKLEKDGVSKFVDSWHELLDTVAKKLEGSTTP